MTQDNSADSGRAIHRYYGSAIAAAARSDDHTVTVDAIRGDGLIFRIDDVAVLGEDWAVPSEILDHPDWKRYLGEDGREKLEEVYENDAE